MKRGIPRCHQQHNETTYPYPAALSADEQCNKPREREEDRRCEDEARGLHHEPVDRPVMERVIELGVVIRPSAFAVVIGLFVLALRRVPRLAPVFLQASLAGVGTL